MTYSNRDIAIVAGLGSVFGIIALWCLYLCFESCCLCCCENWKSNEEYVSENTADTDTEQNVIENATITES